MKKRTKKIEFDCGCGGKGKIAEQYFRPGFKGDKWYVHCEKCGNMSANYPSPTAAVEAWNKSHPKPPSLIKEQS